MNVLNWVQRCLGWPSWIASALAVVVSTAMPLAAADKTRPAHNKSAGDDVPTMIAAEASRRGIPLANIKRQGDYWVGCTSDSSEAACIVLGQATQRSTLPPVKPAKLTGLSDNTVLDIHQYGQAVRSIPLAQSSTFGVVSSAAKQSTKSFELRPGVEARVMVHDRPGAMIDTLPRYRREATNLVRTKDLQLVRDTIDARPEEPFAVIVTVPALCEPCRRLDQTIHDNLSGTGKVSGTVSAHELGMKVFILEYFSFADAERELLGPGAVFPTTLIYGVESPPRKSLSRFIGNLRGNSIEEIARPLAERFRRGSPHTMSRGVAVPELLFRPTGGRRSATLGRLPQH